MTNITGQQNTSHKAYEWCCIVFTTYSLIVYDKMHHSVHRDVLYHKLILSYFSYIHIIRHDTVQLMS